MEKKKNIWYFNPLRAFFSSGNFNSNLLRRNIGPNLSSLGFTLIELLVVIAVIGILATGIVAAINPMAQIQKANDAKRKSDLNQIQKALETYYNDYGYYPASSTDYKITYPSGGAAVDWDSKTWPYMGAVPKDPSSSSRNYAYCSTGGQSYYLYASMNGSGNSPAMAGCPVAACATNCNYGVSSSNVSP